MLSFIKTNYFTFSSDEKLIALKRYLIIYLKAECNGMIYENLNFLYLKNSFSALKM